MYNLNEHSMTKILDVWKLIEILTPARNEKLERYLDDIDEINKDKHEFNLGPSYEEQDQIFLLKDEPYKNAKINSVDDKKVPVIFWHAYIGYLDWKTAEISIEQTIENLYGRNSKLLNDVNRKNASIVPVVAFVMDKYHRVFPDSVVISSGAWFLGKIMHPNFKSENIDDLLSYYNNSRQIADEIFCEIRELYSDQHEECEFDEINKFEDDNFDNSIVMDAEKINYFTQRIMQELLIPHKFFIKKPDICIRKVIYGDTKDLKQKKDNNNRSIYNIKNIHEKPKPLEMFNSFFLEDLNLVRCNINNLKKDSIIKRYLGGGVEPQSCDVLKDNKALMNILDSGSLPCARWPVSPQQSLTALQSAAVTGILNKQHGDNYASKKCFAVNGPPGTGKTTLLADLIANIYVNRAQELVKLQSPFDGFDKAKIQEKSLTGFNYYLQKLSPKLQGFEIVVASTNNGAVENISKELPLKSKIYKDYHADLNLFGWIWDTRQSQGQQWGTVAVVLGNSSNKRNFINQFWQKFVENDQPVNPYDFYNMRNYLNYFKRLAASELNHDNVIHNETKHFIPQQFRYEIFKDGTVKFEDVVMEQWRDASWEFDSTKGYIEYLHDKINYLIKNYINSKDYLKEEASLQKRVIELKESLRTILIALKANEAEYDVLNNEILITKQKKFHFYWIKKFLQTETYRNYTAQMHERYKSLKHVQELKHYRETECANINAEIQLLETRLDAIDQERYYVNDAWKILAEKFSLTMSCDEFIAQFTSVNFDDNFHLTTPSSIPALQDLKSRLFIAAVKLHELFVYANANALWNNLNFLTYALKYPHLASSANTNIAWKSFFMVVPVVSTTLHSFGNLLRPFNHEEISWLLIDEAGQVVPQFAVGALYRSRNVVVMGDPQQTQPVSVLGNTLLNKLYKKFDLKEEDWSPAYVSLQNLADRNSFYQTQYVDGVTVGFPLLVHRRCQEPMFSICNTLSYNNMMISAVQNRNSPLTNIFDPSRWIHVEDTNVVKGQYESIKELEYLQKMLNKFLWNQDNIDLLNKIYIITFFKDYKDFIKLQLCKAYKNTVFVSTIHTFCENNIGTVHAFQGKENDTVILMLGAQSSRDKGARMNMAQKPNVLNVAISRAQNNIYVIGNENIWLEFTNMQIVHTFLKDYSASPYDDYRQAS